MFRVSMILSITVTGASQEAKKGQKVVLYMVDRMIQMMLASDSS